MSQIPRWKTAASTLVFVVLPMAGPAFAQVDPAAIARQNEALERQQQDLLRADQERARRAAPPPGGVDLDTLRPKISVPGSDTGCSDVQRVRIEGATQLPTALREQVDRDYGGRCLGPRDLEAILALVTKSYIDRGFITTRAYLPAQDLRSGVLDIKVVEGTVEGFAVQGPRSNAIGTGGAFGVQPGDLLNLRDLEQGIDQVNRLASNRASLDIRAGSQPGQSVVAIDNPSVTPVNLLASYDNFGTRQTGRSSASATLVFDSLLGFNELVSLTRRQSVPGNADHRSQADAFSASVPFGYSLLGFDASNTEYVNRIALQNGGSVLSRGTTQTRSFSLDRVVYRGALSRVSLSGRLTTQDSQNFIDDQRLGVASRKLAYAEAAVNAFTSVGGGVLNARLAYVQGLRGFGALHDPDGLANDSPHAQFRRLGFELGFSRRFAVAERPLVWSSQLSGQYAFETLYGSQQLLVGGVGSVRGFSLSTLSGDSGYVWRNEVSLPYAVGGTGASVNGRAYVGFDVGGVHNRAPGAQSGSMAGLTLGHSLSWRGLSVDLFASRAVRVPSSLKREPTQFGVRVSCAL